MVSPAWAAQVSDDGMAMVPPIARVVSLMCRGHGEVDSYYTMKDTRSGFVVWRWVFLVNGLFNKGRNVLVQLMLVEGIS